MIEVVLHGDAGARACLDERQAERWERRGGEAELEEGRHEGGIGVDEGAVEVEQRHTGGRRHRRSVPERRGTVPVVGALLRLSADEASVDRVVDALDRDGCVVVERFISDDKVAALKEELEPHRQQTPLGRNDFEGFDTRRIYALFAKVRGFDELAVHPLLLGVLDRRPRATTS